MERLPWCSMREGIEGEGFIGSAGKEGKIEKGRDLRYGEGERIEVKGLSRVEGNKEERRRLWKRKRRKGK
jgi:hypothetical protein